MKSAKVLSALKSRYGRFAGSECYRHKVRRVFALSVDDSGLRQYALEYQSSREADAFIRIVNANLKKPEVLEDVLSVTDSLTLLGVRIRYSWAIAYLSSLDKEDEVPLVSSEKDVLRQVLIDLWHASPEFGTVKPESDPRKFPGLVRSVFNAWEEDAFLG